MSTSSLAAIKKNFGITDDLPVQYEKTANELVLHIPIKSVYSKNVEIIQKARVLAEKRQSENWNREMFFEDFMKVRNEILASVREFYAEK